MDPTINMSGDNFEHKGSTAVLKKCENIEMSSETFGKYKYKTNFKKEKKQEKKALVSAYLQFRATW